MKAYADDAAEFADDTDKRLSLIGVFPEAERVLKGKGDLYAIIYARYVEGKSLRQIACEQGRNASEVMRDMRKASTLLRRSYILRNIFEDVIGMTYHRSSLKTFRQTGYSSVEWAVELLGRLERKER